MQIRKQLLALAAVLALGSAQAAPVTYNFNGAIEDGAHQGQVFSGQFSFDASLVNALTDWLPLSSLQFSFLGQTYTLAGAEANSTSASFFDGELLGIDAVYFGGIELALSNGFGSPYLVYNNVDGSYAGSGSYAFAAVSAVPEPAMWALSLTGLAALGLASSRRRRLPQGGAASA